VSSSQWAPGAPDPNGLWAPPVQIKASEGSRMVFFNRIATAGIGSLLVATVISGWFAFREPQRIAAAAQERLELKRIASRTAGRMDMETLTECVHEDLGGFACLEDATVKALVATGDIDEKDARRVATNFVASFNRDELNHLTKFEGVDGVTAKLERHISDTLQPQLRLAIAAFEETE